jgi:hypothetical protein
MPTFLFSALELNINKKHFFLRWDLYQLSCRLYVNLQNIYQAKAEADVLVVEQRVRNILKKIGKDPNSISKTSLKGFCRNARKLKVSLELKAFFFFPCLYFIYIYIPSLVWQSIVNYKYGYNSSTSLTSYCYPH